MRQRLAGKKILFANIPADGHFNPLTGLAKYCQKEGADVRWYASNIYADKLKKLSIAHYPFKKALDLNGTNLGQLLPEVVAETDRIKKATIYLIHAYAKRATEYYEDLLDIYEEFPFDLLVVDNMFSGAPLIKYKMHIPVLSIGVIPLSEASVDVAPYGMGMPPAQDEDTRTAYAALWQQAADVWFKEAVDVYEAVLLENGIQHKRGFLYDILTKTADLYLQIGTPGFEYKRSDLGANIRFIGAMMPYTNPVSSKAWFDERLNLYKHVVLVTQGTIEPDTKKILEPTLQAFKDKDVLVIATTGGNGTAKLKEQYRAENFIIRDYIPFAEVMPYVTAYITNGGYGGVLWSITNKVPMVAAGLHEGKSEVCARIGYFNCGINLKTETPDPTEIYDAVQRIIDNGIYKYNVASLCREMNHYDALELGVNYMLELFETREKRLEN